MSNQNSNRAIVLASGTELLVSDATKQLSAMAAKVKRLSPGGQRLTDDQVLDLSAFCLINDLNPFDGEAYYIPGVGPTPGVSAWRKRAIEHLIRSSNDATANFHAEFRPATPDECSMEDGDIAYHCTITDTVSNAKWLGQVLTTAKELKGLVDNPVEYAKELIGPRPQWTSVGVVHKQENFAREGKTDKWDRHERAKKRAEKWALRRMVPGVRLADPEIDGEVVIDGVIAEVKETVRPALAEVVADQPMGTGRGADQAIKDLGYYDPSTAAAPRVTITGMQKIVDAGQSTPPASFEPDEPQYIQPQPDERKAPANVPDAWVKKTIELKLFDTDFAAKAVLPQFGFPVDTPTEDVVARTRLYRGWRDAGLKTGDAVREANLGTKPQMLLPEEQ